MSESLSKKDVGQNAERLMEEKEYEQALKNWLYISKTYPEYDPRVQWNIGKGYQNLDSIPEAVDAYKTNIKRMSDNQDLVDDEMFLEGLYALGVLEKQRANYSKSIDALESFLAYVKQKQIELPDKILKEVEDTYLECKGIIEGKISDTKSDGKKNLPYASTKTAKKKVMKGKPYQRLKDVPKDQQRQEVEEMWQKMEQHKMDIEEDSKWYIISSDWFKHWKSWTGFMEFSKGDDDTTKDGLQGGDSPSVIEVPEPGRIDNYDIIESGEIMLYGDINLKDNLTEEQDYIIVTPDIWRYLYSIYDGTPILRTAIKNIDKKEDSEKAECIIEVNLVKLYIFEIPRDSKQDYYEVLLVSRNCDMMDVKLRVCHKKKTKESEIRLWKMEKPDDLDKWYQELEHEWKKYRTLRIDGELFKDLSVIVKDANFSRDDFLMLEYPISTTNDNGYALVEIEKKDIHDALNEKASKALREDESLKEALSNPSTLEYTKIPITLVANLSGTESDESVLGLGGLSNLGNTGFMNSGLQCMSQTLELTKYFCFRMHEPEINHTNVLGSKGRVAEAYGELMNDMWLGSKRKTAPFNVKKSIGTVVAQFRGYNQQDSHEFLHYLIDTLNEDLNRIKEKPYVEIPDSNGRDDTIVSLEQWDAFHKRNDSIMVDLFYGQLKSHLVGLEGDYVSNTFDPFSILSVPVPVVKMIKLKFTYIPRKLTMQNRIRNIEVHINDNFCLSEVEKMIQKEVGDDSEMLFYTYDSSRIGKRLKKASYVGRELVGQHIGAFPYQVDKNNPTNSLFILDTYMKKQVKKMMFFNGEDLVCMPFTIIVDGKATCRDIHFQVFTYLFSILRFPKDLELKLAKITSQEEQIEFAFKLVYEDSTYGDEELYELQLINNRESHEGCPSCRKPHKNNCKLDFKQKNYKSFISHSHADPEIGILWKMNTVIDLSPLDKPDKVVLGEVERLKKSKKIDLDLCLDTFRQDEILDGENKWYGSQGKEFVKARKKMDLFRLPDVLIIHLKRFLKNDHESSFFRNASRKITEQVDFPLKSLDMSEYIINEEEKKKDWTYDLYGVSNHMGKLHGGHYTASCYSLIHDKWFYYDDASVSKLSEKEVIDPAAYILFYRRRKTKLV